MEKKSITIFKRLAAPALYLSFAIAALLLCLLKPIHNWDMLAYIAAVKSFEEKDIAAVHSFTYDEVRKTVPSEDYIKLTFPPGETDPGAYGKVMSTDATAFAEQLPFYQIRPLYTGSIYLLYKLGLNIVYAVHLISGLAVFAGILILYLICRNILPEPLLFVLLFLTVFFDIMDLARLATPDALALLAVVILAYLFLNGHITSLLLSIPILLGVRTDLILFTGPLYAVLFISDKNRRWLIVVSAAASIVAYAGIVSYWIHPGWSVWFYHTLVHHLNYPISVPHAITARDYFNVMASGLKGLMRDKAFIFYFTAVIYSLYLIYNRIRINSLLNTITSKSVALALITLIYVTGHFIFCPTGEIRYFTAYYIIGTLALLVMLSEERTGVCRDSR